jgi:leucyl aminopeptidase
MAVMLEVRLVDAGAGTGADATVDPEAAQVPEDPAAARDAGARLARTLSPGRTAVAAEGLAGARLTAYAEGLVLGAYRYTQKTEQGPTPTVVELVGASDEDALARGLRFAAAAVWTRELTNAPANIKTPAWLAEQAARELSDGDLAVTIRDEQWLGDQGFGGMLAVGGGSAAPPRLIEASYRPRGALANAHVVLVGKGITFDTGGINRKPADSMRAMHTDMAGGAAVLAALRAVADGGVPIRVTALVPAAENSFAPGSYRPGDVVRHYGGRTSEIHNTDAEGRLVLADAMAYAVGRLRPSVLVDIATLTGAMKVALGVRTAGLFATADELAGQLLAAASVTGEPLWRMPLQAEYESALHSDVADATNAPGGPKGITAALFLRPFAGDVPWAHLDIAGPARAERDDGILSRGATGFGARLLAAWIAAQA